MKKPQIQPQDKYIVRMPDGLRDRIKAAADRNARSMNAEIVSTLEEAYPEQAEDFGSLFIELFDELTAIAEAGSLNDLKAACLRANIKLAGAGHGHIFFEAISEGGITSVVSRNSRTESRKRDRDPAANSG